MTEKPKYRRLRFGEVILKTDRVKRGDEMCQIDLSIGQKVVHRVFYRPIKPSAREAKSLAQRAYEVRCRAARINAKWSELGGNAQKGWQSAVRFVQRHERSK